MTSLACSTTRAEQPLTTRPVVMPTSSIEMSLQGMNEKQSGERHLMNHIHGPNDDNDHTEDENRSIQRKNKTDTTKVVNAVVNKPRQSITINLEPNLPPIQTKRDFSSTETVRKPSLTIPLSKTSGNNRLNKTARIDEKDILFAFMPTNQTDRPVDAPIEKEPKAQSKRKYTFTWICVVKIKIIIICFNS
ncbi:unnamed protein product [Trichobilharzia regenti]|nr:unnamed protein product [Trichobilharzia regenti]